MKSLYNYYNLYIKSLNNEFRDLLKLPNTFDNLMIGGFINNEIYSSFTSTSNKIKDYLYKHINVKYINQIENEFSEVYNKIKSQYPDYESYYNLIDNVDNIIEISKETKNIDDSFLKTLLVNKLFIFYLLRVKLIKDLINCLENNIKIKDPNNIKTLLNYRYNLISIRNYMIFNIFYDLLYNYLTKFGNKLWFNRNIYNELIEFFTMHRDIIKNKLHIYDYYDIENNETVYNLLKEINKDINYIKPKVGIIIPSKSLHLEPFIENRELIGLGFFDNKGGENQYNVTNDLPGYKDVLNLTKKAVDTKTDDIDMITSFNFLNNPRNLILLKSLEGLPDYLLKPTLEANENLNTTNLLGKELGDQIKNIFPDQSDANLSKNILSNYKKMNFDRSSDIIKTIIDNKNAFTGTKLAGLNSSDIIALLCFEYIESQKSIQPISRENLNSLNNYSVHINTASVPEKVKINGNDFKIIK